MSHYRNLGGGKRDANEPEIMKRFAAHGWHAEQVSGNRQWDLNAYPPKPTMTGTNNQCLTLVCHVDVKGPKGKVEEAQEAKWQALSKKGIPVYVVRTTEDVDALVRGELEPWKGKRLRNTPRTGAKAGRVDYVEAYTPPRGDRTNPMATKTVEPSNAAEHRALLAAREAEETFAPAPQAIPEPVARRIRMKMGLRKSLRQMETARDVSSESKETLSPGACPYLTCSGDCEHGKP